MKILKSRDVLVYKGFTIDIIPQKGFAGRTWFFYQISGNDLNKEINTDLGEELEGLAISAAMEFIDEHLL